MYGVDPNFWLRLILLFAIIWFLLFLFHTIMRKWLKVEKKKGNLFSYNHVNKKHKKIDWTIRFITLVVLLVTYVVTIMRESMDMIWFLQPWFILFIFIGVSEIVRAMMERKYAENPNEYKLTISQVIFTFMLLLILFKTDFLGLI
ncbi:DUF4181 domain-containing protein [Virgibacillus sp. SK37]|uniref:DUF4181 domain-containing protein n=1 Tax=Virgibacillus sp. SK37 TaxID=403957 RepID=UPI0011A672A0|nr:DUF4181 domain-containing protein [Virgibacillus sp. SK37]